MSRDRELRYGVRGKSLFKYPTLKSLIFRRVCFFFVFFQFSISFTQTDNTQPLVFQKYHPYDHTSWGRSENKLLNYPSFTSVCTKYGLYYSIVIILYNANVLLIGQFIWFQDSITLFYYLFSSNDTGTDDHDISCVLLNALARVLLLRLISPVLFLLLFLLLVLIRFIFIFLLLLLCLLRLRRARRDSNTTSRTVLLHPGSNNRCYFCGK